MNSNTILKKKICLIGAFGVGKTSLIRRFVYDQFDDAYLSTIGVKVTKKILPPIESNSRFFQIDLLIWDIEGYEKNQPISEEYYAGSVGAIAVADITREQTIVQLDTVIKGYKKVCHDAKIIVVGNKIDLKSENEYLIKMLEKYTAKLKYNLFLTSAKSGENVENTFSKLGTLLINANEK